MLIPGLFINTITLWTRSQGLLGKMLLTEFDGIVTGGPIIETEAYWGVEDRACHAYGGRRTKRTEVMFWEGGVAYVYLIYGLHSMFNIVTHGEGHPPCGLSASHKAGNWDPNYARTQGQS